MKHTDYEALRQKQLRAAWEARHTNSTVCRNGKKHRWQPVTLDLSVLGGSDGHVEIRRPDVYEARVYCVCMGCSSWTYRIVEYAGYMLGGPESAPLLGDPLEEEVG